MADIAMTYDRSETDELGIRLTAKNMGIEIDFLPFHKISVGFGKDGLSYKSPGRDYTQVLNEAKVILNRTQSKSRRIFASTIFEALNKDVVNSLSIELFCQSKIRTLLAFFKNGIKIPKTVYTPCNPKEAITGGAILDNSDVVSELIAQQLGGGKIVIKPDAGTHGRNICLAESGEDLIGLVRNVDTSVTNPSGVVAQEFVPKWFYDLRIIVEKEKCKPSYCHRSALVRGGFRDFRTNTFLGNMVFKVELPETIRGEAERSAEILGEGAPAWVIALDAMPTIGDHKTADDAELKSCFEALKETFNEVKKVKRFTWKKRDFTAYTRDIEEAYTSYMSTEAYSFIQKAIHESLWKTQDEMLFHEGNACPEFWEQTRIVGGINVAESLLKVAQSLLDA